MFFMRKTTALPNATEALPGRATSIPTATRHFVNGRHGCPQLTGSVGKVSGRDFARLPHRFAGTKHVLSGGGIRLRNFGPEHIEPFKRPAEPARLAEIVEFVGEDLVLYRPGELGRLERPFGAPAQRHGPGR